MNLNEFYLLGMKNNKYGILIRLIRKFFIRVLSPFFTALINNITQLETRQRELENSLQQQLSRQQELEYSMQQLDNLFKKIDSRCKNDQAIISRLTTIESLLEKNNAKHEPNIRSVATEP